MAGDKRKYSELDLIEKHKVNIWYNTRERLHRHLDLLNKKLEQYDLSDRPEGEGQGEDSVRDLDSLLSRLDGGS